MDRTDNAADSAADINQPRDRLFVRNDQVVEELDLYVEYLMQPVHCIRLCSELASSDLASAVYEQVAVQAYNDHLMTTSKELIGPLPAPIKGYDVAAHAKPSGNGHERVSAPVEVLPSIMIRFFDQAPDDMAGTTLETNVLLAIREVVTRSFGWTLWNVQREQWTQERHNHLLEDLQHNNVLEQKKLGGSSGGISQAVGVSGNIPFAPYDVTRLHFTKRVDVTREVDITEQVLQQQEERAFRDKQAKMRQDQLHTQRYYSMLCSGSTPADRRLAALQLWLDGIEKQEIKSTFIDAVRRTVLHWIVEWSEDAYAKNRLGGDLLRSHIFFALELGVSPLLLDGSMQSAMTIARCPKRPKPRALKILHDAARRSRATSRLPLDTVLFESLAGRFLQAQFSSTQASKFFTLEVVPIRGATDDCEDTSASHCLAIFLYDLSLEWKFPVAQFDDATVSRGALKTLDPSSLRFYVVPFCRESHATTEGDILLCSNGAFVSVDYTAAHPRVKTFRSNYFGFDVVGGEGDGFCCTVQWQKSIVATSLKFQEQRERSQKEEAERAALRVARSSYLSSLAQELHELEGEVEARPKTNEELARDSEDLFSNAFAERILLFPYGPRNEDETDAAGGLTGSNQFSQEYSSSTGDFLGRSTSRSGNRRSSSVTGGLSTADFGVKFVKEESMATEEESNPSGPMGVICVLSGGRLLAIPLSRYALTTHATAPLSDRVSKLVDAVDAGLERLGRDGRTLSLSNSGAVSAGLFTPMAHTAVTAASRVQLFTNTCGDEELDNSQSSKQTTGRTPLAAKRVSPMNRTVSFVNSGESQFTPSDAGASLQSNPIQTLPYGNAAEAGSDSLLHPKVTAMDLSIFCKDEQAPITMTSTPDRILVGLPDGEVVQYTLSSNRFIQVLDELPHRNARGSSPTREPLRGADYPCVLLGVDQVSSLSSGGLSHNATTVLWCGKSLAARTIHSWGCDNDVVVRDILVEDRQQDQETTSAVLHPRNPHLILFSRRGYICVANLHTGFVGRLCPIVLSESEMTMRTAQMDLGIGNTSSGTEILKCNAHGTILMRYSPLYRSAVLYDVRELDAMIVKEDRALVKSANLVCGFDDEDTMFDLQSSHNLPTAAGREETQDHNRLFRAVASVPKERLRGYLERITSSKARQSPQARIDHAYFVVQAIHTCPTFHANVGDGDGRNAPSILASLEQNDTEKDTVFQHWSRVLDDGGNLYQCSHNGLRAISEVSRSPMHIEALLEYEKRQRIEMDLRENKIGDDKQPAWKRCQRSLWDRTHYVQLVPGRTGVCPSRLYSVDTAGLVGVRYIDRPHEEKAAPPSSSSELFPLTPSTDKTFQVLPVVEKLNIVADLVLLPSGFLLLVEHPTSSNGLHRPIATIRSVKQPNSHADSSLTDELPTISSTNGFLSFCDSADSVNPFHVEQVAASWVVDHASMTTDVIRRMWNLDVELPPPDSYGQPQARHAVVGHVAVFARSSCPTSPMDGSRSLVGLRRQSSTAFLPLSADVCPCAFDIPIVVTLEEWMSIMEVRMDDDAGTYGDMVLRVVLGGLERGKSVVKSVQLDHAAPLVELGCCGPFSYLAVRERSGPTTSPKKGGNSTRRRSVTEHSDGTVKLFLSDASNQFCLLPTFRRLAMVAPDGQRWSPQSTITAPSGSPFYCRPLFDNLTHTLHLAISAAEMAVVHVDWCGSEGSQHILGRVQYFVEASHVPSGESVSCAWVRRSATQTVLHADRGNMRQYRPPSSFSCGGNEVPQERTNDEEHVLLFLKEGYLCVLDSFVRKSATIVGSLPMFEHEINMMIRDEDIPDPTAGDPHLASRLPLKVLCGGLHSITGVTHDGYLVRHNALHSLTTLTDWMALCSIATQHADGPDEYGHVAGGIASRTLVALPAHLLSRATVVSSSSGAPSPRDSMISFINVKGNNDVSASERVSSILPEEYAATYVPPLRYDHLELYNLVAEARAPPRSTRLKGFLSRRNVSSDDPQTLAQLLRLFMDAMESNCTSASQRDIRGRTAMHILADLFPHLSPSEKQIWLDRLIRNRCHVFACDAEGESAMDRSDVRSFLYRSMTSVPNSMDEELSDDDGTDPLPYSRYHASSLPAYEPLAMVGTAPMESVVQALWSKVSPSVMYILTDDGCLYRVLCTKGSKQLLQRVPCCVAGRSTSNEQPNPHVVVAKVTAMQLSEAAENHCTDHYLPEDHQPADILLFNTGSVVVVYDPEGDATTHFEATGGFVWAASVSRSACNGDPIAPSRLKANEKQPRAPFDDCLLDMSSGFAPACPSEQHCGIEVVWFARTGEALAQPSTVPVCMAVSARWFHVLQVMKLFAPRGVHKVFPRHLTAMVSTAVVQTIPVVPARPERLIRGGSNAALSLQNAKGTPVDIHFYETARVDDKEGASADCSVVEVELQRFTQIVHSQHSPYGNVFFVALQQGFISQECGTGEVDVHIFSCPAFLPLGAVPVRSNFTSNILRECELYLKTNREYFSLDIARQQLWLALERQAISSCLTITDRTLSWCEGGGGMTVAKWDTDPAAPHRPRVVVLTKGDHLSIRAPDNRGELLSVDRCITGFHRQSATHIAVAYGNLYSFGNRTGEALCYGRIPSDACISGDITVSASLSASTNTRASSRSTHLSTSFISVHNQSTKSLIVIPFERMQRVGRCFLHYSPMSIPLAIADDQPMGIKASASSEPEDSLAGQWTATRSLVDELIRLEDTSALFIDPVTIEARKQLREVIEEQQEADMRRLDERQLLAGMEASQRLTVTSAPEDGDALNVIMLPKECTGDYWHHVDYQLPALHMEEEGTAPRQCPRRCETNEELRTIERLYISMLWPVLRGALPIAEAVDGNGRSVLMYHVLFYTSYFAHVDSAPPSQLSRKFVRNAAVRWERMKEEWKQLLALGASVHTTDYFGCSLGNHYLPLHLKIGALLRSLSSEMSTLPSKPKPESGIASKVSSALADWRKEQRNVEADCRGVVSLCHIYTGGHPSTTPYELVLHTSRCCVVEGCDAFVAPIGLSNERLWESSSADAKVVALQLPWATSGALLITTNAVVAVQHSGISSSASERPNQTDLSRADVATRNPTTAQGSSVALFRKFTVPLRWSRSTAHAHEPPQCCPLASLSHWMSLDMEGNTVFQFAGWGSGSCGNRPFLRMWSCPLSFLRAESLSSLAQYMAQQLDNSTHAHTLATSAIVDHRGESIAAGENSDVGCAAFGESVIYAVGPKVFTCRGTLRAGTKSSLMVPLESLASVSSLVTLLPVVEVLQTLKQQGARSLAGSIGGGEALMRLSAFGCFALPCNTGLLICRVRSSEWSNARHSAVSVVPSSLLPSRCVVPAAVVNDVATQNTYQLVDWRIPSCPMPPLPMHHENTPPTPLMLLFAASEAIDTTTKYLPVAVDVSNSATCGSAARRPLSDDAAQMPVRQVLDSILLDAHTSKDELQWGAPHRQNGSEGSATEHASFGCFAVFPDPS